MWVLEIWTQGLTLAGQVLLSTEPSPQPRVPSLHPYCQCNSKKRKLSFENLSMQRKGFIKRLFWINSVKSSTANNLGPTFFLYEKFSPYLIFHYSLWHPSGDQKEDAKSWLALPPLPILSPGSEVHARFPCTHTMLTLWSGADEVPKFVVPT